MTAPTAASPPLNEAIRMSCPFCGASPVIDDTCPGPCGSLEGLDNNYLPDKPARTFGYDWAQGFVAPFLGIHPGAATQALKAAQLSADDTLIDLGCGDGRIVCAAATVCLKAVGVDLDAQLVEKASQMAAHFSNTSIYVQDLFQVDLSPYSVVTVFLLPETFVNRPAFCQTLRQVLQRGGRIISFGWKIPQLDVAQSVQSIPGCATTTQDDNSTTFDDYNGLLKLWYVYGLSPTK